MENLTGAADNKDTFIFHETGSLSGLTHGCDAGFDTIRMSIEPEKLVRTALGSCNYGSLDLPPSNFV